MLVVRAIRNSDLEGLLALARLTGPGMTTLKPDRKALGQRLEIACASFAGQIRPEQCDYVFVMEDTATGQVVGVSAIKGAVGLDAPFYNYRIGTLVHSSKELNVFSRMDTLYLSNDLTGCAELCSLFLHPDYRTGSNGKLLSKSRFMFIAQFPDLLSEKLIAEMRGYQSPDGRSPFWDSLGQHFFKMDFDDADELTSMGKKSFIAELMPWHPLYVAYLTPGAQQAIGRVHRDTLPAQRLLEQEGMHYEGYVDIFDAGPVLQARVLELRAVRESTETSPDAPLPAPTGGGAIIVATTRMQDFRAIVATAEGESEELVLSSEQRRLLKVDRTGSVRTMPLNVRRTSHA